MAVYPAYDESTAILQHWLLNQSFVYTDAISDSGRSRTFDGHPNRCASGRLTWLELPWDMWRTPWSYA